MDWLMGKARGVSRGLINTTSIAATNTPTLHSTLPSNDAATAAATLPVLVNGQDCSPTNTTFATAIGSFAESDAAKSSVITKEVTIPSNCRCASPNGPTGSLSESLPHASPSSSSVSTSLWTGQLSRGSPVPVTKSPQPDSDSQLAIHTTPLFLQDRYLAQQQSWSNSSNNANDRLPATTTTTTASDDPYVEMVKPFPEMDVNEWMAAHTIALFENLSTVFDAICELCTCPSVLPASQSGSFYSTLNSELEAWGKGLAATQHHSARQTIDFALSYCHDLLQSPRIFPVRQGERFPANLQGYVSHICKHLLIGIIHMYLAHFNHLEQLELISHMNTLSKHYFAFVLRFSLVDEKHFSPLSGFHRALLDTIPG